MKEITAKREYRGTDPETGEDFHLAEGESRKVSDEKAEQLKRDFPDDFTLSGKTAARSKPAKRRSGE